MKNIKEKQKLGKRDTYTPTGAPQACGNCDSALNREETLSVHGLKTSSNGPDVDLQSGMTVRDMRVPVLNMRNQPLMPTTPAKARKLLKKGKAKVVQRSPFTIQLLYATGETKQPVKLGIDPGYKHIGFSTVTAKAELLSGEAVIRTDIPDLMKEKSMYRRNRRNRNTWYRKSRFMNRNHREGWLAPSIEHKLEAHIRLIEKIKKIIPVSETIIEIAKFDAHKMKAPEISGIEYQQGELQGYEIREYLLEKFHRKCAYCGKENTPLEVEHIIPKSRGGSNMVSNLTISCHKCNQRKGNMTAEEFNHPETLKNAQRSLKETPFMNVVKQKIAWLLGCKTTLGSITKKNRISLGIEKTHANDAFVIAGGSVQNRAPLFMVSQRRRNNRCLQLNRKGFKPSIRRRRYSLQPGDTVIFQKKEWNVVGTHSYGKSVIIKKGEKKMDVNVKKVELRRYGKGLKFNLQFLPLLKNGVSLEATR